MNSHEKARLAPLGRGGGFSGAVSFLARRRAWSAGVTGE